MLEDLIRKRKELSGICQYHRETLPTELLCNSLLTHPSMVLNDTISRINPQYVRSEVLSRKATTYPALDAMISELCQTA